MLNNKAKRETIWSRALIIITILTFSSSTANQALHATFSLYIEALGGTATLCGIAVGCFSVGSMTARFFSGRLCDTKGCNVVLMIGAALYSSGILLLLAGHSFLLLLAARLIQGLGFGTITTATGTAVSKSVPENRVAEGLCYYLLGQSFAIALGPAVGLALAYRNNYSMLFIFSALSQVLCIFLGKICGCCRSKESNCKLNHNTINTSGLWNLFEKKAIPTSLIIFISMSGSACVTSFFTLFAQTKGMENARIFFLMEAAALIVVQIFGGRIIDKKNIFVSLIPSLSCGAISCLIIAGTSNISFILCAGIFMAVFLGISKNALNAFTIRRVPKNREGQ